MRYRVDWLYTAFEDLKDIRAYLEPFSEETASRILTQIVDQANSLSSYPGRYRALNSFWGLRRMVVDDYSVFYRILDNESVVQILHIYHHTKDVRPLM